MFKVGLLVVLFVSVVCGGCFESPAIVCDAGSTGTRVYAFSVPSCNHTGIFQTALTYVSSFFSKISGGLYLSESKHIDMHILGKITPGLSSYASQGKLDELVNKLLPIITKGMQQLESQSLPIVLLGTGGVRSMDAGDQQEMWAKLETLLNERLKQYEFSGKLILHAIEGMDEAFYGLVSANHIVNNQINELFTVGVMDLGGSSVEVAHAGEDASLGTHDDIIVTHSQLGTEKVRNLALKECVFGYVHSGQNCRKKLDEIILSKQSKVDAEKYLKEILSDKQHQFLAISAFVYSVDFAYWLLKPEDAPNFVSEFPNPSVDSLNEACDAVCSRPLDVELFTGHYLTNHREAEGRCFDVCFVAELLKAFGFKGTERRVTFVKDIDGKEVEWTLGYYITKILESSSKQNDEL